MQKFITGYKCAVVLLFVCTALVLTGCGDHDSAEPQSLEIVRGAEQTAKLNSELDKPLTVKVYGSRSRGILGGQGDPEPLEGINLRFEPADAASGLSILTPPEVQTDKGGYATARIQLGDQFGDQYVRVRVLDGTGNMVEVVRFAAGIELLGHNQETFSGNKLPRPLALRVMGSDGEPISDVPVYFSLIEQPGNKGKLTILQRRTDENGMARAELATDPGATGKYRIMAEVADHEKDLSTRGVYFKAMAFNRLGVLIAVLGGLGVFVLGMRFMSEGLQRMAGPRLKTLLHFFTGNRFKGIAAGALITGMIQSSTACTVMVVGFVNAGLLSLQQAIGVIFGANIGTTITGQMISFKLDGLALPAITVGVILLLLSKRSMTRNLAQTTFGFGLLFLGMTMMSTQLKVISEFPSFIGFFQTFDCTPTAGGRMPLGAVLGAVGIGTALTVLVQSSSATIGLTIALAASGLINFYTAVPLILGDNIGTTVTALLASIGTNRTAKQSALAHTIFNLFGATYMIALLYVPFRGVPIFMYLVNQITAGEIFAVIPENVGRHVASAHSLFNLFNVIIFVPLVSVVALICRTIIPVHDKPEEIQRLEPHLLNTPAVALQQTISAVTSMTEAAWNLVTDAFQALLELNLRNQDELAQREKRIDQMQHDISAYLVDLTQRELQENQADVVPLLIHCVNDAERVGDHAENLLELTVELKQVNQQFTDEAKEELQKLFNLVNEQAQCVVDGLNGNEDAIHRALKFEGEINLMTEQCHEGHINRLGEGKCTVASGVVYVEVLANLERIGDHLSNIAERATVIEQHRVL